MSALSGKRVVCLTKGVLQKMRNDASFRSFHDGVLLKSKSYPSMSGLMLPRRTRAPRRIEIGTGEPTYPVTAQDYYRRIYFEAIDLMMNTIDQRFDQPSYDTYTIRYVCKDGVSRNEDPQFAGQMRRAKVYGKTVQR